MSALELRCRVCGSNACKLFQKSEPPYHVYRCESCSFAFVHPLPDFKQLTEAYNQEAYYAEWISAQAKPRKALWAKRARRVLGDLKPGQLLDVGCGEGSFLNAAQQLGWTVRGTEISASGCRIAGQQWQLGVFNGALEAAGFPSDEFDVVTLWHVIEHVPDPLSTMKEVARITRPGGRIVVACPNRHARIFNAAYRLGRFRAPHLFHPADRELHLSYFTVKSLRRMLESCGLKVACIDVDRGHVQPIKHGLDLAATAWHRASGGVIWSEAMEFWAEKPKP